MHLNLVVLCGDLTSILIEGDTGRTVLTIRVTTDDGHDDKVLVAYAAPPAALLADLKALDLFNNGSVPVWVVGRICEGEYAWANRIEAEEVCLRPKGA